MLVLLVLGTPNERWPADAKSGSHWLMMGYYNLTFTVSVKPSGSDFREGNRRAANSLSKKLFLFS